LGRGKHRCGADCAAILRCFQGQPGTHAVTAIFALGAWPRGHYGARKFHGFKSNGNG
jgi:hypothetical protein